MLRHRASRNDSSGLWVIVLHVDAVPPALARAHLGETPPAVGGATSWPHSAQLRFGSRAPGNQDEARPGWPVNFAGISMS